jgi:hypothetical protein
MTADILEYLNPLDSFETKKIFALIRQKDLKVQCKILDQEKVQSVHFVATESSAKINLVFANVVLFDKHESLTFKIKMGTDVYFFRATLRIEPRRHGPSDYFVHGPFTMYKLMRRKETRFAIPVTWTQEAVIVSPEKKVLNIPVKILDLSNSGMKILVGVQIPRYEKKQQIQLSFKLNRRTIVAVEGIIRHVRQNKIGGPILGVEFIFNNSLIKNKIQNICDDLAYQVAHNSPTKL